MPDIVINADALHAFVASLWQHAGSNGNEAVLVAEHLVMANLTGHDSHGVGMIPRYVAALHEGGLRLNQTVSVVRDAGPLLTLDGLRGFGQSIAWQAMQLGIERAKESGVGVIALRNTHHLGRLGHWAEQCAAEGMVSFHFVNVAGHTQVAPWSGSDGRFGTNPFAAAWPRPGRPPLVLDFATSSIAVGKVRVAHNKGLPVAEGCLVDHAGVPATDPSVLTQSPFGALLPFGQHKGFGLAVMCELLAGALTGGYTTHADTRPTTRAIVNGLFSVILAPDALDAPDAQRQADAFLQWVKASPAVPGQRIYEPGEPERLCRQARLEHGIPVDVSTWAQIVQAARQLGFPDTGLPVAQAVEAG